MQKKALIILRLLDDIEKNKNDVAALKRAMLSARRADPVELFPEVFGEKKKDIEEVTPEEEDQGVNFDYSEVTWKSGSEAYEEYERLMAQVASARDGTMSGDMFVDQSEKAWTDWS